MNDKTDQAGRERIVLIVYAVYTVIMAAVAIFSKWERWTVPLILIGMIMCCLMYFKKYRDYNFRACVTSLMMWMNFSIYIFFVDDFTGSFSTMCAMIILLAIYCRPNICHIGAVVYTFHLLYHFIFLRDLEVGFSQDGIRAILRIMSVYVAQYVTYCLIKNQLESNSKMLENVEEIHKAEQSKDDFMANMSHEIRTPINTVCGISEMVLREDLPEKVRTDVYDIQNAGRHLLSLVSDILDFTELQSGKMEIVPDTYNITSTVNDILNMAVAKISGKPVELIIDCDAQIPSGLVGDEQKIRRAIMNVVDNAIKFTEEGGVILSVTSRSESYGVNLVITVKDTGIGMSGEALETLFTRFSQVDTKRNRQVSGMGLGLSITKVIVNKMGGFITAKSVYGKGTEVQLVFPQQVSNPEPAVTLKNPERFRVMLYIDNDKYQNMLVRDGYMMCIRNIVKSLGVNYFPARNLAELKRRMEKEKYTHLFVSWKEYCEDREYFETLSENKHMHVVLVLERDHKENVKDSRLLCVYKPFYVLTIAAILNGQYIDNIGRNINRIGRFIAPEANVLVVDDNLMNLKVVEGLLRPYKVRVFVAESGKEALEKVEHSRFDMIFMDHMMPEMDGIETFHRIRQKPGNYYQTVPIVALTANAIGGAREMFLQEGFADYVAKPIEISALERVLYKHIPESKIIKNFSNEEENNEKNGVDVKEEKKKQGEQQLDLEGIDVKMGIGYCGGEIDDYIEVVRTYHGIGVKRTDEIRGFFEKKDWENYTILVHAVKSTSLNIGAAELSEMAKALEAAGKNGDGEYIESHNLEMLDEYERVLGVIGANTIIFPESSGNDDDAGGDSVNDESDNDSLEDINKDGLLQKIETLSAKLESFEMEEVMECLTQLASCKYQGKALKKLFGSIEEKASGFDFIGAQEELEKLRDSIL